MNDDNLMSAAEDNPEEGLKLDSDSEQAYGIASRENNNDNE